MRGWILLLGAALLAAAPARADVVTEWNKTAVGIALAGQVPAPPSYRVIAIVQTAVYEAVNAITKRYPERRIELTASPEASIDAAVAAANHVALSQLVPSQSRAIDSVYAQALAAIPDDAARSAGIALGESAALACLSMCARDGAAAPEAYRPHTTAGVYVATSIPATPQWPGRKTWILDSASQFRPGPPPLLSSETWARDYNEIKAVGARQNATRTAEQTKIARFWESTTPAVYFPVVNSVAEQPGREVTQNARLLAVTAQAVDDALIAIMDAKYHYGFWRPVTAIRNGDTDGNDATERDPSWLPFVETPLHPEYPCAHCIVSGTVGTILDAEIGAGTMPTLRSTSPTAPGAVHTWSSTEEFMREVAEARICDGVHFRTSTEVGTEMGRRIGRLAAEKYLKPSR